ncbi:hypothetical protein CFK37_14860 [Virgibacillus phasianinus]|uniref:DUF2487 domain-containing protein n=1 Tax=Virgibacillus phasianinus TaxID=2017483 RepID=A0A220U5N0_9BACI|nr:DUF2487 family protein [Virgibacillus phasianinus]ASK63345.1 hypothetical protein CFK37_14860 [Virgibacillus phasianinus]
MRWVQKDLLQYIEAKEFVDTIIIPLAPFHLSNDSELQKSGFQSEALSILMNEIERDLAGRVMVTPTYAYLKGADKQIEIDRLNKWQDDVSNQPVNHIFFLTFDSTWKKHERLLNGTLLWLPGLQSGDLYSAEMQTVVHDQVNELSELIRSYWETME